MMSKAASTSVRSMATKAGIVAPLSNRVYLFNFFEKPPMNDSDFHAFWADTGSHILNQQHFLSTHLHRCIGPDSKFQWINFGVFDSNDVCVFRKPDPEWARRMQEATTRVDLKLYPGEYSEISSYTGDALSAAAKERPDQSRFLVTAVTADDSVSSDDLEENWKSWMKTDFIHEQLKGNTDLRDSLMYRLVEARIPLVRYTVRTELAGMDDKDGIELAKLVNDQQNANGVKTVTGFYRVHTNAYFKD